MRPILLLDEATSALDSHSEQIIQAGHARSDGRQDGDRHRPSPEHGDGHGSAHRAGPRSDRRRRITHASCCARAAFTPSCGAGSRADSIPSHGRRRRRSARPSPVPGPLPTTMKSGPSERRAEAPLAHTDYSHSIVAGGLPEMSYTTREMPGTSLTMRRDTRSRNSYGRCAQCAVMKSMVSTARSAIT